METHLSKIDPDSLPIESWLPISRKEMEKRGWEQADIILLSGDAYVDHPSFGIAVIGRYLEKAGYKVAILPQPNWKDDLRDFKKLGRPRLFFGVSAGSMDSMVNHYTARKRLRSNDAYTPGGQAGFRPDYPTVVYTRILKQLYPDVPVLIGGIEASMRRVTHYDYWQDSLRPSFLVESSADLLVYGMGEKPVAEVARQLERDLSPAACRHIPQVSYLCRDLPESTFSEPDIILADHETCLKDKRAQARNFALVETASNRLECGRIIQKTGKDYVVINPPFPFTPGSHDIDEAFDLPYTRLPHPRYKNRGEIPAFVMICNSVNLHRGCFGGCSFCTISAHQGKQVRSRSEKSILDEIRHLVRMPYFKGNLSDLGGPSANMYGMKGKDAAKCAKCKKASCLFPAICPNLDHDHAALLEIYRKATAVPGVKRAYIGSGIRYDMIVPYLHTGGNGKPSENHAREYIEWVIGKGVSGRLKVAPEHTESHVLKHMRKMPFPQFEEFKEFFDRYCRKAGLNQQLIPYFISAHPGCTLKDMQALQTKTRHLGYQLEQVQLFTPTPMTLATETYYTGFDPYTLEPVFTEHDPAGRDRQTDCFFWYKRPEMKNKKAADNRRRPRYGPKR
ncbi:MAG: YgiQ family radical SAM protein [Bacteroidales bacterium]|nr:YgiQ family radical SAM protein [Bacteroidales bacterium]